MIRRPPRSTLFPTRRSSDLVWTEVSEADVRRVRDDMPVYFTTLGGADQARPRRWSSKVRQVLPSPSASQAPAGGNAGQEIGRASCRKECRSRWSPYH